MKTICRITLGAALLLMATAVVPQAQAACGAGGIIEIAQGGSLYLDIPGGNGNPGGYGYDPTLTTNGRQELYWQLGAGSDVSDAGVDSDGTSFITGGESTLYPGYFYAAYVSGAPWAGNADVDGCPTEPAFDPTACTCVLITDQWEGNGYFAMLSDLTDGGGNYRDFPNNVNVALARAPLALVQSVARNGNVITVVATANDPGGVYLDPACTGCAGQGFKLGAYVVPDGTVPDDRSNFIVPDLTGGGAQGNTPFGTPVSVDITVAANENLYMTTVLGFDSGFDATNSSENSPFVSGDPTLADPGAPRVRPIRPRPAGARPGKAGGR